MQLNAVVYQHNLYWIASRSPGSKIFKLSSESLSASCSRVNASKCGEKRNIMLVRLKKTQSDDLDFVLCAEHSQENRPFVVLWSEGQHSAILTNENMAHMVVEANTDRRRVGYVILAGLGDPNRNIEFKRIVITEKSFGFGRSAVKAVKHYVFECLGAHRLWLHVLETNRRARTL